MFDVRVGKLELDATGDAAKWLEPSTKNYPICRPGTEGVTLFIRVAVTHTMTTRVQAHRQAGRYASPAA